MLTCYHSVKHKLENRVGYFDLLGFDFMLDSDLRVSDAICHSKIAVLTNTFLHIAVADRGEHQPSHAHQLRGAVSHLARSDQ